MIPGSRKYGAAVNQWVMYICVTLFITGVSSSKGEIINDCSKCRVTSKIMKC
jgi:hypothetical protein